MITDQFQGRGGGNAGMPIDEPRVRAFHAMASRQPLLDFAPPPS